jgi:hypothetical protein
MIGGLISKQTIVLENVFMSKPTVPFVNTNNSPEGLLLR